MRLSFFERYGGIIVFILLCIGVWWLVDSGAAQTEKYFIFSPYHWLPSIPYVSRLYDYIKIYESYAWWMWIVIAFDVLIWMVLFFLLRGIYYKFTDWESSTLWITFAIGIAIVLIFMAFALDPVRDQIEQWWGNWPGMGREVYPGET